MAMRPIETYKLVTGKDDSEFCYRITKLLAEGYELHGSPSLASNGEYMIVAQAVIKREPQVL